MRHAAEEQGWAPGWHRSKGRGQKMLTQAKERGLSGNGLKAVPPHPLCRYGDILGHLGDTIQLCLCARHCTAMHLGNQTSQTCGTAKLTASKYFKGDARNHCIV